MSDLPGEVKVVIGVWALAIITIVLAWYAPDMAGWLERRRKRRGGMYGNSWGGEGK